MSANKQLEHSLSSLFGELASLFCFFFKLTLAKCIRVPMSANKQLEHSSSSLFGELESLFFCLFFFKTNTTRRLKIACELEFYGTFCILQ